MSGPVHPRRDPPLLFWQQRHAVEMVRTRRMRVAEELERQRPRSYRSIVLQARLKELTLELLELERDLGTSR